MGAPVTAAEAPALDPAITQAVDWMLRLSSGEATEADARELEAWRSASLENERAFRLLSGLRPTARALKASATVNRRAVLSAMTVGAVGLGSLGLVRPPLGIWPSIEELLAEHRTGTAERYCFSPIAGVDVEMNARTSLSRLAGGAGLSLVRGEAFVDVRRPEGFRIAAGAVKLDTTRAALNVETIAGGIRVGCISGRLSCARDGERAVLGSGEAVSFPADGPMRRVRGVSSHFASWRDGVLIFDGAPLGEVMEELNRYRSAPVVITSAEQAGRSVSGVFYTDRIDAAVTQLGQLLGLRQRSLPGGVMLLG